MIYWQDTHIRFDLTDRPEMAEMEKAEVSLYHYSVSGPTYRHPPIKRD